MKQDDGGEALRGALAVTIGLEVRRARERLGWSQGDLAERAAISRPNVVRLEQGRHLPTLDVLWRIAQALGVPVGTLVSVVPVPATTATRPRKERTMTYRNFTGWSPYMLMGTDGSILCDVPPEPRSFYGGADATLWTKDVGNLNVTPFHPSHLPPQQAGVVVIVRPEVAAQVRDSRPDVWDGSSPR